MAKNKLRKFNEIAIYSHVVQPTLDDLQKGFNLKGKWKQNFFKNDNPLVIELGCGKGEYSVALAKKYPNKNFLGVDIKGSRIWAGATESKNANLSNIGFLRTRIEFIELAFSKNEVDEIWITFPDPQIKSKRAKKRLTSPLFLKKYNEFLKPNSFIHLKTDSQFLYGYTIGIVEGEGHYLEYANPDVYNARALVDNIEIKTHYENIFLKKNLPIAYCKFKLQY